MVGRRALLLAGAAFPASAYGQCVINAPAVDACLGGVRNAGPAGATLDLNFMFPGSMPPGVTFTRASTATYTDASGVIQTAAVNQPRWEARGLLIEEARTNTCIQSNAAVAPWTSFVSNVAAPVVTANSVIAPDGTLTATRLVFPACAGGTDTSSWYQPTALKVPIAFSVYLRGNVGGEQTYLSANDGVNPSMASPRLTLTTQWRRYVFLVSISTAAAGWSCNIGTVLYDSGQAPTPAQTIYAWGAQIEVGAFATSLIPTTVSAIGRSPDLASMPLTPTSTGTYAAKFIPSGAAVSLPIIISGNAGSPVMSIGADSRLVASIKGGASVFSATAPALTFNAINKVAFAWLTGASKAAVNGTLLGANAVALTVSGTSLQLGSDGVTPGNNAINGALQTIQGWSRQLSDTEMQQVTT